MDWLNLCVLDDAARIEKGIIIIIPLDSADVVALYLQRE